MSAVAEVKTDDFENEVLKAETPVMVDFTASWCGPCKQLAPVLDDLAGEYDGKGFRIVKVDVDNSPDVASKYGVMSVPTLILFKGGEIVDQMIGAVPKDQLKQKIDGALGG